MKCPKCHFENQDDTIYCGKCATPLKPPEKVLIEHTETLQAAREELTTGSTFAGRYQIIEELGSGGMGRVYRALDKKLNEEMALKLIKPEIASDKKTVQRFSNELKIARKIGHKNVSKMFDLNEEEGTHYITMEYVSGEDLKSFIRRSGRLTITKAIDIASQICDGLAEAHRLGVVHRDLKPSNIMIDKDGNSRIMDFGIARFVEGKGITGAGVMIGTPEYMSPEQVESKEVDQRSDIYSLGVILYEMVTGRVPFEGDTALSVAMKHKSEIPKNPKELNAQISEDLSRVVLKCMEKEKKKRYRNTEGLLSELEKIKSPIAESITVSEWKKSIAVLPFTNMSADPEQEYFCDGMAEEIINSLTHIKDLRVIARTSAFAFKGKHEDIREIGRKLDVETLLEGSVRKSGNRLRIMAQLINVADGSHLWSERYDRNLEDVFDIQDEISLAIVENLKIKLLKKEKATIIKQPTEDIEAYQIYMKGRYFLSQFSDESCNKAIEYFNEAIKRDPSFALPYAGIAESYVNLCKGVGIQLPSKKSLQAAKEAALKAVELGPELAETHSSLGIVATFIDWDRVVARDSFKKALELNPNSANSLMWYAAYLIVLEKKYEDALKILYRVLELDPLYWYVYAILGWAYSFIPNWDKLIEETQKFMSLNPNHWYGYHLLGEAYLGKGLFEEAIKHYEEAIRLGGRFSTNISELGYSYACAGDTEKAMDLLKEMEERANQSNIFYGWVAILYIGLGLYDKASEWFEKALELHDIIILWPPSLQMPGFDNFRKDPRYKALMEKAGLDYLVT